MILFPIVCILVCRSICIEIYLSLWWKKKTKYFLTKIVSTHLQRYIFKIYFKRIMCANNRFFRVREFEYNFFLTSLWFDKQWIVTSVLKIRGGFSVYLCILVHVFRNMFLTKCPFIRATATIRNIILNYWKGYKENMNK